MIRHIVLLKLTVDLAAEAKQALLKEVRQRLLELPGLIPEIGLFEVGINLAADAKASDLVILSEFKNSDDLNTYLIHPAHLAFVAWNRDKCPKSGVVDYAY